MKRFAHDSVSRGRPELKREMGLWTATAMVIGNMIGSGVFLLPALLAGVAIVYGSSALLAWAMTGAGAMLLAGVFATMGRAYPKTGGPYVYARRAFGDFVGFLDGLGLLDRGMGRQRGHRDRVRRLHDGGLARPGQQQPRHGAVGGRCGLAPHVRERPRSASGRPGPAGHDGPEVRAAGLDRHHRPVLLEGRPLHAVHPRRTGVGSDATGSRCWQALRSRSGSRCGRSSGSSRQPCRPRR